MRKELNFELISATTTIACHQHDVNLFLEFDPQHEHSILPFSSLFSLRPFIELLILLINTEEHEELLMGIIYLVHKISETAPAAQN
uniref:Uncharacterized protein n=1 Tax=Glossina palpalis gambiensis TaxID=67801 RepID=A0A1B0AZ96_9MUSC